MKHILVAALALLAARAEAQQPGLVPPSFPTPLFYGAKGDGVADDTAPLQAAVNARQHDTLYLGPYRYLVTGSIALGSLVLQGAYGGGGVYDKACPAGIVAGGSNLDLLTKAGDGVIVRDLCIVGHTGDTGGSAIKLRVGGNMAIENVQINGPYIGVDVSSAALGQNNSTKLRNVIVNDPVKTGFAIGSEGAAGSTVDLHITDSAVDCHRAGAGIGVYIEDAGGLFYSHNDVYGCAKGMVIAPGDNQTVEWGYFGDAALGDTSLGQDVDIGPQAASAAIRGLTFNATWASNGTNSASVRVINPGGGMIDGLHFQGHRTIMNATQPVGLDFEAGKNITVDGGAVCVAAMNSGAGIAALGGVADIAVRGVRIGGCDGAGAATLAIGISLAEGVVAPLVVGNDTRGSIAGLSYVAAAPCIVQGNIGINNAHYSAACDGQ